MLELFFPIPCLSQVLLRVSTFVLNGVVLRYVQAYLLGVVNLRYLSISLSLYLSI